MKKRLLSSFLSLALLLTMLPVSALAAETLAEFNFYHDVYEYNPVAQEYIEVYGEQRSALNAALEENEVGPENQTNANPVQTIMPPDGKGVTTNNNGLPQMTSTYNGKEYTWVCIGFGARRVQGGDTGLILWNDENLSGYTVTFRTDYVTNYGYVDYVWAQADRMEDTAPQEFRTVTFSFDLGSYYLDENSEGPGPNVALNIPDGLDFSNATMSVYGSNTSYSSPSKIQEAVSSGTDITELDSVTNGKLTAKWPDGYYLNDLNDALEAVYGYAHYYIRITCEPYEWYGHVEGWRNDTGESFTDGVTVDQSMDGKQFYARYHTNKAYFADPVAAEGYTQINVSKYNDLEDNSMWSQDEFSEIEEKISVPDWTWPSTGFVPVPSEDWSFTVPAPSASSMGENGEVYLTDGEYTWQCVGVRYGYIQNETTDHVNWNEECTITIEDTATLAPYGNQGYIFIEYLWKILGYETAPETYAVEYEFSLPEELSEVDGRKVFSVRHYDDNWGSYDAWDMSGDGYFSTSSLNNMINDVKEANIDIIRAGKSFVVMDGATYDFRDFLAFNEDDGLYFDFAGWKDEADVVHQIGETVELTAEMDADNDGTVTLTPKWEQFDALSDKEYQEAVGTLKFDIFEGDPDYDRENPVLITQWTDADPNTGMYDRLTGNPVVLNENETIHYEVSARINTSLLQSTDPNAITIGNYAQYTFSIDIDPKLEFADEIKDEDGNVTLTYTNSYMKLAETNITGSPEITQNGNEYTVTFDPDNVPENQDGGMHLEFTVNMIVEPENTPGRDVSDELTISGLAFQLKDSANTGEAIETSANVTGSMDLNKLSNAGYHDRFRFYIARNLLMNNDDWQEFFGSLTNPQAYIHALQFMDRKLTNYDLRADTTATLKTNTAMAYTDAITVTPADMTIYEGGSGGYDAVVNETGETVSANSLPHPIFKVLDAPEGIDVTQLTFTNADSGNQWKLTQLEGSSNLYRFTTGAGTDTEVRVQYSDGNNVVVEDEFTPTTDVCKEYTISIYNGNTSGNVTASTEDGKAYLVETNTGTLTVRAVQNDDPVSDIAKTAPVTKLDPGTAAAVEPEGGTTYTLNNTGVQLPENDSKPSLLFDDIIEDSAESTVRTDALKNKADAKLGAVGSNTTRNYEIKYLDLVDANNGNAWITSSAGTDIYWAYPDGTNSSDNFTLLHFKDLHRDGDKSGFDVADITASQIEEVTGLEKTDIGIKFHVGAGGFSPYALVWEESTGGGGGGGGMTSYTITASAGAGGSIDPSGSVSVTSGSDKTFAITADEGYKIADVLVDGESVGAVNEYTFENVRAKHTIEAWFTATGEIPVADPDDTGVSDWLNTDDHIAYMNGYPDQSFRPDANMTRAEAAQMFYNLLLDKEVPATAQFTDVAEDAWYADAVNTLASLGMINGVGGGKYEPTRSITRAEFTAIAMRFADLETGGENIFSDVAANAWYYDYVVGSIQYGWINGYPDGTFRPNNTITRAEVTAIVNRMLNRSADTDYVDAHTDTIRQFIDLNDTHWSYYHIMEAANAHDFTIENGTEDWTGLN